ncbi:hypothetical protein ACFLYP_00105 [Chloroflexota bacterium]
MLIRITVVIVLLLVAISTLYVWVYRPWSLNWGATDEEINRPMGGDDILEQPTFVATRAITINASPEEIWPWIIQIGYQRAGFYSYDRLDNDGIHSSDYILPEYQGLQVGDFIPMTKEINAVVIELDPYRSMVMDFQPWVWAWGLYETDQGSTRLVTRVYYRSERFITNFMVDTFEIFMMRKCLLEIKQRVENQNPSP